MYMMSGLAFVGGDRSRPELPEPGIEVGEPLIGDVMMRFQHGFRGVAGDRQQAGVEAIREKAEVGQTALARAADEVAGSAQLEILFGQREAVVGGGHGVEPVSY